MRQQGNIAIWLVVLALVLAGCAPPAGRPPDLDGWRVLYRRDGAPSGATADLRAVGDIMLGRSIATIGERQGLGYPFAEARPLLAGDLALGNLESPLTERRGPLRPGPYRLPAPTGFAAALREAGFGALSLANNHALDVGAPGLQDAHGALGRAGVLPLGIGPDRRAALEPALVAAGGLRLALLAVNDVGDPQDSPAEGLGGPASGEGWGRAWLDERALASVRAARDRSDAVVVLVHWGREYEPAPTGRQREWARRLVAAGADLVLGAHPHVLQPAEVVEAEGRTGYVAYSLGNFIFDQSDAEETRTGAVLRVLLDRGGVALAAAAPVEIVAGQARPLAPESPGGQAALARLGEGRSAGREIAAWSWDGSSARPADVTADLAPPTRARGLLADLRGDGRPLWVSLDDRGVVEVHDGPDAGSPVVWRNEAPDWRVAEVGAGDLDRDGRIELLLLLWRPSADGGRLGSHPFLVGWRGGRFGVLWGGSATDVPMQHAAAGDLDGDGWDELVVLEGGRAPGDPAERISVLTWRDWVFELRWRSPAGRWSDLALQDLSGDGRPEIVVWMSSER